MQRSRLQFMLIALGMALGLLIVIVWNAVLLSVMWRLHLNDLGKFYYDAQAFVSGQAMYGPSPATEIPLSETVSKQFLNLNPPHMHLLLLPLALLEPLPVLIIWLCSGLACMGLTFRWALRETGQVLSKNFLIWVGLALFASVAFGSILVTGQITMHLLPLVAWAWIAARHRRWMQVGVALGLGFSIKPFLLIFLPWLAIRGKLSAAGLSVLVCALFFAVGIAVFGSDNYAAWLSAMARIDWHEMSLNASLQGFLKRALQETLHHQPIVHAPGAVIPLWIAGFGIIGLLSLATVLLDGSARAVDRAFTILLLAAILMSPLGWIYYLLLALPSAVGLMRHKVVDPHGLAPSGRLGTFLCKVSLSLAALLVLCPTFLGHLGQPSGLLTVTLGSAHFWAVFFCWFAALLDGQSAIRRPTQTVSKTDGPGSLRGQILKDPFMLFMGSLAARGRARVVPRNRG